MNKLILMAFLSITTFFGKGSAREDFFDSHLQPAIFNLTLVMMHDVVNPPAASRYYAYCLLGAYQITAKYNRNITGPQDIIPNLKALNSTKKANELIPEIAALYCILETGRLMLPSGYDLEKAQTEFKEKALAFFKDTLLLNNSYELAMVAANQAVEFSRLDNYNKLSAKLRYSPSRKEGTWRPTPPAYMEAVEPNWRIVKPMFLDSASQCKPLPPTEYSKDSSSNFYQLAMGVYSISKKLTPEQLEIAAFWDCNPFVVATSGHMSLGFKKISPGGHWMNITCIAARTAHLKFESAVQLLAIAAITQFDAFISCWDEKYRSNRIRPETFINKYIDVKWQPLLQTPPFPEYCSGHSVVSSASSAVLTYLLGDNLAYTDDTEVMFELAPRTFPSFYAASKEASISRFYGGIHFMDAIENGQQQGYSVGNAIVSRLQKAGIKPLHQQKRTSH